MFFNLTIFHEVSLQDEHVWTHVRVALATLVPWPFVVFTGDIQQLQPVEGAPLLKTALDHQVITQTNTNCFSKHFQRQ